IISNADARHDRDDCWSENHDEDRWEDAPDHGEEHLHRRLGCSLLGPLTALDAKLVRLDLQHLGDRHAELLCLHDGANEVVDWMESARLATSRSASRRLRPIRISASAWRNS